MKQWKCWLLLSVSALAYGCAFLWPEYCFWMVFIFLIPLYHCAFRFPHLLTFKHGLWWGMQFFCLNLYAVIKVFYEHSQGDWKFFAPLLFILYFALHAGLWFLLATRMVSCVKKKSSLWVGFSWFIATMLYFYWVRYGIFWIFGVFTGYAFGSPLLVLAECSLLLRSLPIITETGLLAILVVGQLGIAYALSKRSAVYCLMASCYLLIFLFGPLVGPQKTHVPDYVSTLGYVKPSSTLLSVDLQVVDLQARIIDVLHHNPALQTIIMPESTLSINLNNHPAVIQYLCPIEDINIIIGAHRSGAGKGYNSLYWIKNGGIVSYYDKKIRTPFFEYVAYPWNQFAYFNNLFLKDWQGFDSRQDCLDVFALTPHISLIPRICSELYFSVDHHYVACDAQHPILFVVSESWFSARYYKRLFYLYAVFQAIQSKRDIIYVGHEFGRWISKTDGGSIIL